MEHTKILKTFLQEKYPIFKDIEITKMEFYTSNDTIFNRPINPAIFNADTAPQDEYDGVILEFNSTTKIPITDLANLCNILCYGVHWAYHYDPEYWSESEFQETLTGDLDTCWHHSQITKVTDSYKTTYKIEQGYCMCS